MSSNTKSKYIITRHLISYVFIFLSIRKFKCNIFYNAGFIIQQLIHRFVLAVLDVLLCNRCARCAEWGS